MSTKSVKFGGSVKVVLIPSRDEYDSEDLWYNATDFEGSKLSMAQDIQEVMRNTNLDCKSAFQKVLYDSFDEEDEVFTSHDSRL